MIISEIIFHPYKIPFKDIFISAKQVYNSREGIIIEVKSGNLSGFGEVAPLPGYSEESLIDAKYSLEGFALSIENTKDEFSLEDLLLLAKAQSVNCPSALFGLETAIYDLFSKFNKIQIWQNFSDSAPNEILINGLEKDINNKKYSVYKLKLVDKNIFKLKEKISNIENKIGKNSKIRIDANESLDITRAIRLCKELEDYNIEYIEQPLPKNELEDLSELRNHTQIPIAVDESLTSIESAKKIIEYQAADIFVLKPMLMGSYQSCIDIIKCGEESRIKTVITTTIGTEIERYSCIQIAFATDIKLACGFSTTSFLLDNVVKNSKESHKIELFKELGLGITPTKIPYI